MKAHLNASVATIAFDPKRTPVAALQRELERRLAVQKLSLMLLQVMDRPADFSPSALAAIKKGPR